MRLDFERTGPALANVNDAGVLSRPLQNSTATCRQSLQMTREDLYEQCSLHMTLKMPSSVPRRLAPAKQFFNPLVFVSRQVRGHAGSSGVIEGVARVLMWGISIVSYFRGRTKHFYRRARQRRLACCAQKFTICSVQELKELRLRRSKAKSEALRIILLHAYTEVPMKSIIVGTAGHIDHGKTALVKALTGIDADRLRGGKAPRNNHRPGIRSPGVARAEE